MGNRPEGLIRKKKKKKTETNYNYYPNKYMNRKVWNWFFHACLPVARRLVVWCLYDSGIRHEPG
jgi:hypothetical protein